ncbi:MAG: peptide chain release factor 1 [Mycoplasmoidaceae bacterium]
MSYNKKLFIAAKSIYQKTINLRNELESITDDFKRIKVINQVLKANLPIIEYFNTYSQIVNSIDNYETRFKEETNLEMKELIKLDFEEANEKVSMIEEKIKILLLPKDDNENRNIIVEMRPAAGGDEASIFVSDLYQAYIRYAQSHNWKTENIEIINDTHGISFISFIISGEDAYSKMKYESGVHRVQRVPATEAKGRVHTSTITVAIMPEIEDIEVEINKSEIREDRYCASGAGGQHVNKTQSAVRITHIPTGIVVACQEGKSQHSNRDNAMRLLKSKIYEYYIKKQQDSSSLERKNQVGRGDRSEKIRTYNYPQNRVTDHRVGLSINKLDQVMQGNFDDFIQALTVDEQARKMAELNIDDNK